MARPFQRGDHVSHKHGRVTWRGIVHALEEDGRVRVEWGTGVRERMKPEELTLDLCEFQVSEPPWYIRTHQCSRWAVNSIGGKRYCTQHSKMVEKRNG